MRVEIASIGFTGAPSADAALAEFQAARDALLDQARAALADLPAYRNNWDPTLNGVGGMIRQSGWAMQLSIGRGVVVIYERNMGADDYAAAEAGLAPHAAALQAAGLTVKPRQQDGRPVLLVYPPPPKSKDEERNLL